MTMKDEFEWDEQTLYDCYTDLNKTERMFEVMSKAAHSIVNSHDAEYGALWPQIDRLSSDLQNSQLTKDEISVAWKAYTLLVAKCYGREKIVPVPVGELTKLYNLPEDELTKILEPLVNVGFMKYDPSRKEYSMEYYGFHFWRAMHPPICVSTEVDKWLRDHEKI